MPLSSKETKNGNALKQKNGIVESRRAKSDDNGYGHVERHSITKVHVVEWKTTVHLFELRELYLLKLYFLDLTW